VEPSAPALLEAIFARAFRVAGAPDANAEIARLREEYLARCGSVIAYEVVAETPRTDEPLHVRWLRLFSLHLRAKRTRPYACAHVFVAVFRGEALAFLRGEDFTDVLLGAAGFREGDLHARFTAWKTHEDDALAPIALGPPVVIEPKPAQNRVLALPAPPEGGESS
jgi:hypothetical protein